MEGVLIFTHLEIFQCIGGGFDDRRHPGFSESAYETAWRYAEYPALCADIYTLELGVAGAAIATAVSQAATTFLYLCYIFRRKSAFSFRPNRCCFSREIMAGILKIGVPILIFQLLTSLSVTLVNRQAKGYGDSVIAGMGAVTRMTSMGRLMVFGFIKGSQPIAGYHYGAGKFSRLREAVRTAVIWSTLFCAVFGAVMILFPSEIISQFTKGDVSMIEIGQKALRANGISFFLFGFSTVYSSLFLALGKAKEGFILGGCTGSCCKRRVEFKIFLFGAGRNMVYWFQL